MNAHLFAQQMREAIPSLYRTCPNPPSPPREHFKWADNGWVRIVEGNAEELAQWTDRRKTQQKMS